MKYKKAGFWVSITGIIVVFACVIFLGVNRKVEADNTVKQANKQRKSNVKVLHTEPAKTKKSIEIVKSTETVKPTQSPKAQSIAASETIISIHSISKDGKFIKSYSIEDQYEEEKPIPIAKNCRYMVNQNMSTLSFEEVTFKELADYIATSKDNQNLSSECAMTRNHKGQITSIKLLSKYNQYGIYYLMPRNWDDYELWKETIGDNVLEEYYKLTYRTQISSSVWPEDMSLEVYTGNAGDGDSGFVLLKDHKGKILYNEMAHYSRPGWNNIYYGKDDLGPFLMSFLKDSRDDEGGCSYRIYRLTNKGEVIQTEGSSFTFGFSYTYDKALFKEWMKPLENYMKNSVLLLSTQDCELRMSQQSEFAQYNYEVLKDLTKGWY